MGNYDSRQSQLAIETINMFKKGLQQTNITKKNLISLNRKFKALKEIDKKEFGNLSNRATAIMKKGKGLNLTKKFTTFHQLYTDFVQKVS